MKRREDWNIETEEVDAAISPTSRDVKAALTLGSNVGDSRHISEAFGQYVTCSLSPTIMCGDNAGNNTLLRYALHFQKSATPLMLP